MLDLSTLLIIIIHYHYCDCDWYFYTYIFFFIPSGKRGSEVYSGVIRARGVSHASKVRTQETCSLT